MAHPRVTALAAPGADLNADGLPVPVAPTGKLLLTVGEAAKLANVGRSTGYELCRAGVWPTVRISPKLIRVPVAGLLAWIERETRQGPQLSEPNGRIDRIAA